MAAALKARTGSSAMRQSMSISLGAGASSRLTEGNTMLARRTLLRGAAAGAGLLACPATLKAQTQKVLKLSHQSPGGPLEQGDFRDRLCRKFAAEVEKRTNGAVRVDVY